MKIKHIYGVLASPWYFMRPLQPQHQSREAWVAYMRAKGLKGDGTPL